jgi:intraflagellar transport protein 81
MRGITSVVYPLLSWLLSRMEDLSKRAYLARYLRNIDVPEEMFADAGTLTT